MLESRQARRQGRQAWYGQKVLLVHSDRFDEEAAELQGRQEELGVELQEVRAGLLEEIALVCEQYDTRILALENPQLLSLETKDTLRHHGIECVSLADLYESLTGKVPVATSALEDLVSWTPRRKGDSLRQILNLLLAGVGLFLLSPLYLVIALAIRIEDGGSAFFIQDRVGKDRESFRLIKFRSMVSSAGKEPEIDWMSTGPFKDKEKRITRVGNWLRRFRLDELPQLVNVVKGDINLVGPRPERPHVAEARAKLIPGYERRLQVRPGVTGWAQIHYPYQDAAEKLGYDLYYIQHRSIWFDFVILLRTFLPVLGGRGR